MLLFLVTVKWNKPSLYSFQSSLPTLPLPSVEDTMKRYLRSVRPLLDDAQYEKVKQDAQSFQDGIGKKLQRYLMLKKWWATNYVSDWWEEYIYLRGRTPLMINSNVYGCDGVTLPTNNQAARAANITYLMIQFRRRIEKEKLEPIMVQGFVPLCSWQYERMFNTTRVPGVECDKIVHWKDSKHVAVYYKGCYYKVLIHYKGKFLNALEIQHQLETILKSNDKATTTEHHLAALTAWERTKWAHARDKYFAKGVNKTSLEIVESAALFLALDDEPYVYSLQSSPAEYGHYAKQLFHGNGANRWFDKSYQLCVASNARVS